MTLRQKQSLLVRLIAQLVFFAEQEGYELTYGEAYRSPEEAARLAKLKKGIKNSLHTDRLAVDFNLFKNGKLLRKTEDHMVLGGYWESLHPLCRWGGRFGDGNHYSITHGGRK
jgi:uncharacterized protein YcbK (DUF882 family)